MAQLKTLAYKLPFKILVNLKEGIVERFSKEIQIRWSDFDPNYHVRHTSYYDWGTLVRVHFFELQNMPLEKMITGGFGPVILREECVFKREVKHGDQIIVGLELLKAKRDFSRWTIQHPVNKKNEDILAALITIDGGFLDHKTRKLIAPGSEAVAVFNQMPKSPSFSWSD